MDRPQSLHFFCEFLCLQRSLASVAAFWSAAYGANAGRNGDRACASRPTPTPAPRAQRPRPRSCPHPRLAPALVPAPRARARTRAPRPRLRLAPNARASHPRPRSCLRLAPPPAPAPCAHACVSHPRLRLAPPPAPAHFICRFCEHVSQPSKTASGRVPAEWRLATQY